MCKDAEILLLDEPTSALDGENASAILEAIERYSVNKTVIHVTHRPEHLKKYDRIFTIKGGRLDELGQNNQRRDRVHGESPDG